jgi:hypothetical protein
MVGAQPGLDYSTVTNTVTVLVTGPQPLLDPLTVSDLSVQVDVSGLSAGESAQLAPSASILDSGEVVTTSVLPALIDVEAHEQADAETTPDPGG